MLNRKGTNFIRFILDELFPPILRDNYYFMYPLFFIWFKGKNVKRFMEFKSNFHKLSEEEFANYYKDYDYISNRKTDLNSKSIRFIIDHLDENKDIRIADIGCGDGYVLHHLQKHGFNNIIGVDIAQKSAYENIEIINGNIEHLPFQDNSFDVVICNHTLEHVMNLEKAVQELKRIAKKKLIITIPRQKYYKYTFDLHLHFFPQISYLLKIIDLPEEQLHYKNIQGDWSIVSYLNQ